MEPILTPAEMAEADRRTIAAGTPFEILVGRAGRAVARVVLERLGGAYGRRVVLACGKGNNGADGRVAAAALRARGVRCEVLDLEAGFDRAAAERAIGRADALVDAMYGTGFRGALEGDAEWFAEMTEQVADTDDGLVVAVDIPSGVDGTTGAIDGVAVHATHTVTFAAWKPGLLAEPGRTLAGMVRVADIGIDLGPAAEDPQTARVTGWDAASWWPSREAEAHKWSEGPLLVVGGSPGLEGAPTLAAVAGLRSGSGIVWAATPSSDPDRRAEAGAMREEWLDDSAHVSDDALPFGVEIVHRLLPSDPDGPSAGSLDDAGVDAVLAAAGRFGALVVGPGLGTAPSVGPAVRRLVAECDRPLLLDADALTALAGDPEPLLARAAAGLAPVLLTPHEGEFARLDGPVGPDRIAAARRLAAASGATVLLKGPSTVVADPNGRVLVADNGGPWLATAGTGDVLSGIAGSLLAAGLPPIRAGAAAAWLHGEAAGVAGHTSLVAGDLVAALTEAIRYLTDPMVSAWAPPNR